MFTIKFYFIDLNLKIRLDLNVLRPQNRSNFHYFEIFKPKNSLLKKLNSVYQPY